jgi:hypothetical protein
VTRRRRVVRASSGCTAALGQDPRSSRSVRWEPGENGVRCRVAALLSWFPSWTGQGTEPGSRWRVDGDEGVSAVDGEAEG